MSWDLDRKAEEKKQLMEREWLKFRGLGAGPVRRHVGGLMQISCRNGAGATVRHLPKRPGKPHAVVATCCGTYRLTVLAHEDRLEFESSGEHDPAGQWPATGGGEGPPPPERGIEAPADGPLLHPVLVELGLAEQEMGGAAVASSPVRILHRLLAGGQVSADAVRNAARGGGCRDDAEQPARQQEDCPGDRDRGEEKAGEPGEEEEASSLRRGGDDSSAAAASALAALAGAPPRPRQEEARNRAAGEGGAHVSGSGGGAQKDGGGSAGPATAPPHFDRHVALHVSYNGERYSGLAENVGKEGDNSIERHLFGALVRSRLVSSRSECGYSRCGRTDRGVSAAGQVVALRVRSAFRPGMRLVAAGKGGEEKEEAAESRPIRPEDLPGNSFERLRVLCPARNRKGKGGGDSGGDQGGGLLEGMTEREVAEHGYDKILNSLLPPDIRVLGWCPVSPDFSARFSASSRTYRYFFVQRHGLRLGPMRAALSHLVGSHDFRNFCRMDVEKVYNFERTVYRAELMVMSDHRGPPPRPPPRGRPKDDDNEDGGDGHRPRVCYFEIHGQAFLWHQIRCIASVLFMIGRGLEEPGVVLEMLDVQKHPGKPSYPLADEVPLVLHSCDYENLAMGYSVQNLWSVAAQMEGLHDEALVAAARLRSCADDALADSRVLLGDLLAFVGDKLAARRRRELKSSPRSKAAEGRTVAAGNASSGAASVGDLRHPFGTARHVRWKDALDWMRDACDLAPGSLGADSAHVPLLRRQPGPTYEEKVAGLRGNSKRRQRYEENVIKKRKTKEEDAAFYRHMVQQGSSNA